MAGGQPLITAGASGVCHSGASAGSKIAGQGLQSIHTKLRRAFGGGDANIKLSLAVHTRQQCVSAAGLKHLRLQVLQQPVARWLAGRTQCLGPPVFMDEITPPQEAIVETALDGHNLV